MKILGIDPGVSESSPGALALWDDERKTLLVEEMPRFAVKRGKRNANEVDPSTMARVIIAFAPDRAMVEDVWAMDGDNVASLATLMKTAGVVAGILAALFVPTELVLPQVWKRAMRVQMGRQLTDAARKDASRKRASELLPQFSHYWMRKKDHGRADAALIAAYAANLGTAAAAGSAGPLLGDRPPPGDADPRRYRRGAAGDAAAAHSERPTAPDSLDPFA